jgi:RNA polymerase sigma-70 factor (ECF subfamily)
MARVRLGDEDAVAQLLLHYEKEVQRTAQALLSRSLRSYLDPADLVQSVHRTLLHCLREDKIEVASPEKLCALAVTVARRKIIQHWRHRECERRFHQGLAETEGPGAQATVGPTPAPDPVHTAEYKELLERLRANLDETEQRVVELRLQGYSTAAVARKLGLDADVLRVRLGRLRHRLQQSRLLSGWL